MATRTVLDKIQQQYSKITSYNLEQQLVGSLIHNSDLLIHIGEILQDKLFYDPKLKVVFNEIVSHKGQNNTIEYLASQLKSRAIFKSYEEDEIKEWLETTALKGINSGDKIKKIVYGLKEMEMRRRLLRLAEDVNLKVMNHEDIFEINDYTKNKLSDIYDIPAGKTKSNDEAFKEIEKDIYLDKRGLSTGYGSVDKILYGLERGDLILIGARASMGKTAFALNIANNVSKAGGRVLYISIEMTQKQLLRRLLSIETGIEINSLGQKQVYEDRKETIYKARGEILKRDLTIIDDKNKLSEIEAIAKRETLKKEFDLIVVDYLQIVRHNAGKTRSRENEVSEISGAFKALAKDVNAPIIALSQLSRASEGNKDKRPSLANLRESGSLENDADTVMLLHRPDYYDPIEMMSQEQDTNIIIAKGRNTGVGEAVLTYKPFYTKFEDKNQLPI